MTLRHPLPGTPRPMHVWEGAQGNRLCGDSWGKPSAQAVLLLHGGGQTRHSWRRTAKTLADAGFYAVAYDARGHGDSDWVACDEQGGGYGDAAMAADLACVLRAMGIDRPVLIGASMGGITGMTAAGNGVVDAAALILADVAHITSRDGYRRVRAFMEQYAQGFSSLDEAARAIGSYKGEDEGRRGSPSGMAKNLRRGKDGRLYWHWDPRFLDGRGDLAERELRLTQCVRQLRIPTLLVRGAHSDVVTPEAVEAFLALNRHTSHVDVAEAGHMLTGDDNDIFGRVAIDFIHQKAKHFATH